MDIGIIHSVWTVLVLIIFIGIVVWAWNGKHKQTFDKASRIPLEDDDTGIAENNNKNGDNHA